MSFRSLLILPLCAGLAAAEVAVPPPPAPTPPAAPQPVDKPPANPAEAARRQNPGRPASAQAEVKLPAVAISSLTVRAHDRVILNQATNAGLGLVNTLRKDGHIFVVAEVMLSLTWTDETKGFALTNRDVSLVDAEGRQIAPFGWIQNVEISLGTLGPMIQRPGSWKDKPSLRQVVPVFAVPTTATGLNLVIREAKQAFAIPPITPQPDPCAGAAFSITGSRLLDALELGDPQRNAISSVAFPGGRLLEVALRIDVTQGNNHQYALPGKDGSPGSFLIMTSAFAVRDQAGAIHPSVAHQITGVTTLGHNVLTSFRPQTGIWPAVEARLYFPVPTGLTGFTLLAMSIDRASSEVGAAAPPPAATPAPAPAKPPAAEAPAPSKP